MAISSAVKIEAMLRIWCEGMKLEKLDSDNSHMT